MAHSRSSIKRIRQNERRRARNRANRSRLRTQIKRFRGAVESDSPDQAGGLFPQTASLIDRMVKKGVIHRNAGSRYKSRLETSFTKLSSTRAD